MATESDRTAEFQRMMTDLRTFYSEQLDRRAAGHPEEHRASLAGELSKDIVTGVTSIAFSLARMCANVSAADANRGMDRTVSAWADALTREVLQAASPPN